ncbi:hypothetical protein PMIN04_001941 [Paraphaeosphaeria minitans]|uniref:Uncharacterized protein n=1 Tax=Paraphaeosphaeria minitans TaxID=565426 RepID=A0A9P6KUW6_9PLEO|nr:hypothetical protein PMIN01_02426 [Paraphaeosphaeria minitans]
MNLVSKQHALAPTSSKSTNQLRADNGLTNTPSATRKNTGFTLCGNNGTVKTEVGAVESLPFAVEIFGDSKYRFNLIEATGKGAEVGLRLYRETGPAVGLTGKGDEVGAFAIIIS